VTRAILITILTTALIASLARYRDTWNFRVNPEPAGTHSSGVVFWDHWRAQDDSYNIINEYVHHSMCRVLDMAGRIVYEFPHGFCYFLPDGSAFFSELQGTSTLFDPKGNIVWQNKDETHHDENLSPDGQEVAVLTKNRYSNGTESEGVKIYAIKDGQTHFTWSASEHYEDFAALGIPIDRTHTQDGNDFHLNSVQILPPNDLEAKNPAFRHGNILTNCFRSMRAFIIDRQTGKVVWQRYFEARIVQKEGPSAEIVGAHTVNMLPNGHLIMIRNDHSYNFHNTGFSTVEEMDALTGEILWRYSSDPVMIFHTPVWGGAYRLDNGNVLVSNSAVGSAFEVDHDGRIVWEWVSPERDANGLPTPIYRVTRVSKKQLDPIIARWRELYDGPNR